MSTGLAFWILMLVWLAFGLFGVAVSGGAWYSWGGNLLVFILLVLLGWHVFGAPIHG